MRKLFCFCIAFVFFTIALQGVYQYQLTVTDNKGATGKDTVSVPVNTIAIVISTPGKTISDPAKGKYSTMKSSDTRDGISSFAWINTRKEVTQTR